MVQITFCCAPYIMLVSCSDFIIGLDGLWTFIWFGKVFSGHSSF